MNINILYLYCSRNINFCHLAQSVNVKGDQCRQTIDWHNISGDDNEESGFVNEEVDRPNKITNATTTTVECSNETSPKIQSTVDFKQILFYLDSVLNNMYVGF